MHEGELHGTSEVPRNLGFGDRVRAARAFARGMSQAALAERIRELYPGVEVSARTIKRVEAEDPGVRGTLEQWSEWVGTATGTPVDFLELGFGDLDLYQIQRSRWANYALSDWLRIALRTLWFMRREDIDPVIQKRLLLRLRREGGIPFTDQEIERPREALGHLRSRVQAEDRWTYEKVSELLGDYGVEHTSSDDGLSGLPFPKREHLALVRSFVEGEQLTAEELKALRVLVQYEFRIELDPDPGIPEEMRQTRREHRHHRLVPLIVRLYSGGELDDAERTELRAGLDEFMQHPEILTGVDWQRALHGEPPEFTILTAEVFSERTEEREADRLARLDDLARENQRRLDSAAAKRRSAADDPLPPPGGELASGPPASGPTEQDREPSPIPAEQAAREGAGG